MAKNLKQGVLLILLFSQGAYGFDEQDQATGRKKTIESPAMALEEIDANKPAEEGPVPTEQPETAKAKTQKAIPIDDSTTMIVEETAPSEKVSKPFTKDLGLQGEIGSSSGPFYARLVLQKRENRYLEWDLGWFYSNQMDAKSEQKFYALEGGPKLILANPTIFFPFAGVALGYEGWKQQVEQRAIDEEYKSVTAAYYGGLLVKFTKNFGLTLSQRIKYYLGERPLNLATNKRRDNPQTSIDVGFVVTL